ncbi:MAG TPA: hypothetical protein VIV63_14950, partial [Steroidobacteraceae bacterium]
MRRRAALPWLAALFVVPALGAPAMDPFANPVKDEAALRAALSRPAAKLLNAQVLRGQFQHSRHLKEIPRPLIATG